MSQRNPAFAATITRQCAPLPSAMGSVRVAMLDAPGAIQGSRSFSPLKGSSS